MSRVLILEEHTESASRLGFLLQLASHQCTFAHSVAEAASWLRNSSFLSRPFELLLLGGLPEPHLLEQLLAAADQVPELPVVCLDREGSGGAEGDISERIVFCAPDGLLQVLHKFLADTAAIGRTGTQRA